MIKIGITGIIGSGKSTVSMIFEICNVPVFNADQVAKDLYRKNSIKEKIQETFGEKILNNNNEVDMKLLSEVVFSSKEKLERINSIIHPEVKIELYSWINKISKTGKICAYESALLFESGFNEIFDYVINVSCNEETCIKRVMKRNHISRGKIIKRMKMQMTNNEKSEKADYIIKNDGEHFLTPQVLNFIKQILQKAKY